MMSDLVIGNEDYYRGYQQGRADAIDECIRALDDYIEFPMTDEYVIKECMSVLEELKEQK